MGRAKSQTERNEAAKRKRKIISTLPVGTGNYCDDYCRIPDLLDAGIFRKIPGRDSSCGAYLMAKGISF